MAFVAAPNVAEVEIRAVSDGQHIENRIMVDMLAEPTPASLLALAELVYGWCDDEYSGALPDQVQIQAVVATSLQSDSSPQVVYAPGNINGTIAGGALPLNATLCMSLKTGSRGRSARGRFYLLALGATQVTQNTVHTLFVTNAVAALEALRTAIEGAGWVWIVCSFVHGGAPRVGGPVYFPITTVTVFDQTVDSQRRRLPGRGT